MLFHVRMDVSLPHDMDPNRRAELVRAEKDRALELQKMGVWPHLWRVVVQYSNISIFDVESADELHEILWNLPLFPYMDIEILPLTRHGSDIKD